jgi:hypothetical protein
MAWIPFEGRTTGQQQAISSLAAALAPAQDPNFYYNEQELGLKTFEELDSWLADQQLSPEDPEVGQTLNAGNDIASSSAFAAQPDDDYMNEADAVDVETLRWLRSNADEASDKELARRFYLWTLFKLWRKHVADTGQTYYPPMQTDLMGEFQMISDPDA